MPHYRKPPVQPTPRAEGAPPLGDSLDFSVENTTLRLKSLRLRRREQELTAQHQQQTARQTEEVKRAVVEAVRPSGRVRHDERGMAVWDLAIATGEFQTLSATSALKKLEVDHLKIEETARMAPLSLESTGGRDKGGGFDPYNQASNLPAPGRESPRDRHPALSPASGKKPAPGKK